MPASASGLPQNGPSGPHGGRQAAASRPGESGRGKPHSARREGGDSTQQESKIPPLILIPHMWHILIFMCSNYP